MTLADADLVTAIIKRQDHLKSRARWARRRHDLLVPFSVGLELLFVAKKHQIPYMDFIGAASVHFDIENGDILRTAAEALDEGTFTTVFDAVHAATALHAGRPLLTTDRRILASGFPAKRF